MTSNLNLLGCEKITDNGLRYLTTITSDLNLWGCEKITDNGL